MASFHVEATSKCTLECALCDRTWFYEKFKRRNLHEIDIDHLAAFVGVNAHVELCGNNGDPIYHSKFHELVGSLKENNCVISIVTNGSSRTVEWWMELAKLLDENDRITFSVDGLEDTNHLYRKNSKWHSIMDGVQVMTKAKRKTTWKYIVFKHNQHQIREAEELSKHLGIDSFKLEQSSRWLGKKELMPDREFIDDYFKHQEKILIDKNYTTEMRPECMIHDGPHSPLYIDSEGDFYPCCYMGTYRYKYKSLFAPTDGNFNIKDNTFNEIMQRKEVIDFFNSTKQFTSAHDCCKIQCGVKNG